MNRIGLILILGIGIGTLGFADGFRGQLQTSQHRAESHVACEQISEEEECRSRMDCAWKGYCHGVPR